MAVVSDGSYGIPEGLICSVPCKITGPWEYEVVQGLTLSADVQARLDKTIAELSEERDTVADLL